jgi:anion-transporting  ArsA/GET3 family ATPase
MAGFISELNELFGGFKERAKMVEQALRSKEVSFVLVTSPAPMSIQEVMFFSERLEASGMPRGAFVINRFRLPPPCSDPPPTVGDAAQALAAHGLKLDDDAPERMVRAHSDAVRLAALDAMHVRSLNQRANGKVPIVRVPELASDVHDLSNLALVAETIMTGGV